jgi:hypothetical protein
MFKHFLNKLHTYLNTTDKNREWTIIGSADIAFVFLFQPGGKSSCTEQHNCWDAIAVTQKRAATNPTASGKGGIASTYIILDRTVPNDMRRTFPRWVLMILKSLSILPAMITKLLLRMTLPCLDPQKAGSASSKSLPLHMHLVKR